MERPGGLSELFFIIFFEKIKHVLPNTERQGDREITIISERLPSPGAAGCLPRHPN